MNWLRWLFSFKQRCDLCNSVRPFKSDGPRCEHCSKIVERIGEKEAQVRAHCYHRTMN